MEDRGQLVEICFLLLPRGRVLGIQFMRLSDRHLYPLSRLVGPSMYSKQNKLTVCVRSQEGA